MSKARPRAQAASAGSGAAVVAVEARAQLELPQVGARSARESSLPEAPYNAPHSRVFMRRANPITAENGSAGQE